MKKKNLNEVKLKVTIVVRVEFESVALNHDAKRRSISEFRGT